MDSLAQLDATQALLTLLGGEVLVAGKDDPRLCQTSVPLSGLEPILLSELRVDEWHARRVLYGTLRGVAVKLGQNLVTIIVDDAGNSAKMMIQNVTLSSTPNVEASRLYPDGIRVAVKEPCLENGRLLEDAVEAYVNVQSAAHIEIVSSFSPERLETLENMDAQALRNKGNGEFLKKYYVAAKELYTLSIGKASRDATFDKDCLLLAYSNRAECYLKLNVLHKAVADADHALAIDSSHTKTLYRKGRALYGMQEYKLALESLQLAFEQQPEDRLGALVAKVRTFVEQSQGIYNLSTYFMNWCWEEDAPELGEYVGPVEIRLTGDGQRRGLFATKDVKAGELLIVCNGRGLVDGTGPNKVLDSACMIIKDAIDSPRVLQQLKLLAVQFKLIDIQDAPGGRGDVNMSLFRPNGQFEYDETQYTEVNVDDIFDIERLSRKRRGSEEYGSWLLPDFMNHSCIGNVSDVRVGSAKLFRASRDVAAGEELTYCYVSSCTPLAYRQNRMRFRSMDTCSCKRCILEQSLQLPLERINAEFGSSGILIRDPTKRSRLAVELEKKLQDLALTREEVQWLRASYALLYVAYYSQTGALERMLPVGVLVEALLHSVPGSFASVAIIAKLGLWKPLGDNTMVTLVKQAFHVRYGVEEPSVISAILQQIARVDGEAAILNAAEPLY